MEIISSDQNPWIKKLKALQKRKYREEYGQFVIEGTRFCKEAILHNAAIEAILINEELPKLDDVKDILDKYSGKVLFCSPGLLEKHLSTVTPQGIAAIVNMPNWDIKLVETGKTFLILDGIQDPGNLGTIIRTTLAAGVDAVFCLKGTVDIYNDKTLRSTMGAVFKMPVFYIEDTQWLLEKLQANGIKLILADIKGELYHFQVKYPEKIALVLGSEASGLQRITTGDYIVKIPLSPDSESLNVAIAGSIILYEVIRQRML
ncbi:MAG: RNA methyltransferase [Clostridia bacterium]|nr:RNA methyltransferase [Clostridia bacterium]